MFVSENQSEKHHRFPSHYREMFILIVIGVVLTFLFAHYELFEAFYQYSRSHESWELDEIIVVVPVLTVLLGLFSIFRVWQLRAEMANRSQLEQAQLRDSTTNRLTGLSNEHIFLNRIDSLVVSAGSMARGCIAVIRTNARFVVKDGHKDQELPRLMSEIIARCQSSAPAGLLLASMDNDTLLAFLPENSSTSRSYFERVSALLSVPMRCGDGEISLSVRIGVAAIKAHIGGGPALSAHEDLHQALASSVRALETINAVSRNTLAFHDAQMEQQAENHRLLINKVEAIVKADGFGCAYQPIIDLSNGATTGFEVLARWPDTQKAKLLGLESGGELITPDVFVPLVEEAGLIDQFTDQILDHGLKAAAQWPAHIGLNINISRIQLRDSKLVQGLLRKLKSAGVAPQRLTVEITETSELPDTDSSLTSIKQLRAAGICVAVDDFGAGYANLNFLHDIEFDVIKIDRKIISDITTNQKDQAILRGMIAMTSSLSSSLTAEGVETEEIASLLRKLGVKHAQGYLFAKPMGQKQALEWIKRSVSDNQSLAAQRKSFSRKSDKRLQAA